MGRAMQPVKRKEKKMSQTKLLEFRWSISRGRDTYGYNICSLWVDGSKVSSCDGGGYDMSGWCLGDYLEKAYQDRLITDVGYLSCDRIYNGNRLRPTEEDAKDGRKGSRKLYGSTGALNPKGKLYKVMLDGACGISSMERIAERIGLTLEFKQQKTNRQAYVLTDKLKPYSLEK
jgi:hypothetical protein